MTLPAEDYRAVRIKTPDKLYEGLDHFHHLLRGYYLRRDRIRRHWLFQSAKIIEQSLKYQSLSDRILKDRLAKARDVFRRQKQGYEQQLPEAFALIAEASARVLGMRPYSVQISGAIMIFNGYLAEMATGEGKTLTGCIAAIADGWSGKPVHIVTANEYLASRDARALAPLYKKCFLDTGWVGNLMPPAEKKENYKRDIVYTTSKELLADYLKDRLMLGNRPQSSRRQIFKKLHPQAFSYDRMIMRGIDTVIVDEADSVLIDEAVTPLIISQAHENKPFIDACRAADHIANALLPGMDYRADRRYRDIALTRAGEEKVAEMSSALPEIFHGPNRREEIVLTALTAREFFQKDREYVVEKEKVVIVDEFTGRLMPQRSWRQGLHQLIEAREGLPLSDPVETLARLSFQRFFRFFRKLGGMTGTAREASNELWHIYELPVLGVPTNRPCIRKSLPSQFHPDQKGKWEAIRDEVCTCHETRQPVLIGTRSVAASETLAALLRERNIPFQLLNAVQHQQEANIIATAGQSGAVTIATNMAGRGADIKLGKGVPSLGGLHVIVSEPHASKRIDRQLYGRCARQGDPGSFRMYCSIEDELLMQYWPKPFLKFLSKYISRNRSESNRLLNQLISIAQKKAQRQAFRQRKGVMQMDDWLTDALSFARSEIEN